MPLLNNSQFRRRKRLDRDHAPAAPAAPSLPAPTTEGWHPDLAAGTLRWHGPGGVPTDRLARWND